MFLILYLQILINGSCVSYAQSDQPHVNIRNFVLQCPTYLFADYAETYCLKVESKGKGVTTMRSFSTEGGYCKLLEKKQEIHHTLQSLTQKNIPLAICCIATTTLNVRGNYWIKFFFHLGPF